MDSQCFSSDYGCTSSDGFGICYLKDKILSFTISPSAPKAGAPLTLTVQGSVANAIYGFSYQPPTGRAQNLCTSGTATSCTFTPAASDVGTVFFIVNGLAPQARFADDNKVLQVTIGAQQ